MNGHDFDVTGVCTLCKGSMAYVATVPCAGVQWEAKPAQDADKPSKPINEMKLEDYRRGVAKISPFNRW
jgi:hypothetical protein